MSGTLDPGPTMAPTANALGWTVLAGTVKGSAHDEQTPNQDAHGARDVVTPGGARALVVVVADGHGGQRYVRSATGSRMAVDSALDVIETELQANRAGRRLDELLRDAAPLIVRRWRADVQAHADQNPFTGAEQERAGSELNEDPFISYGSTLIVAVTRGADVALAQLGDGDAVVRVLGDTVDAPVPGDDRLVAGETTSLCLPGAERDFRYASVAGSSNCDLVLLASDGYGNAFASATWRTAVLTDLGEALADAGKERVAERLPGWLADSARVGGDDVTVALLVREPVGDVSARVAPEMSATLIAPEPPAEVDDHVAVPEAQTAPRRRRLGRRFFLVLAVLGVLAVAVIVLQQIRSAPAHPPHNATHALVAAQAPAPPEDGART